MSVDIYDNVLAAPALVASLRWTPVLPGPRLRSPARWV